MVLRYLHTVSAQIPAVSTLSPLRGEARGRMVRIVSAYRGMPGYIVAARSGAPQASAWSAHVLDPFWGQWAAGEFNEARLREDLSRPVADLDGLEKEVAVLETAGVEGLVEEAYTRIAGCLPYHAEDAAVCVFAADPADRILAEQLDGVAGSCAGGNTLLTVNPCIAGWRALLPYVLAHERHHSAWGFHHFVLKGDCPPSLLASLVNEGLADSFAHHLYPQAQPSWIDALSPDERIHQWQAIQPFLRDPDGSGSLYRRFFFGDPATGTPPFAAYTLGFHLVQSYLRRRPQTPLAEWVLAGPEEILADFETAAP
jgi:uncharacterized protein YjaZ